MNRPFMTSALAVGLLLGAALPARAQGPPLASADTGRLQITLLGGWTSFAHAPINSSIRVDNFILTAPVDSGGVGLDEGLSEIADGLGFGAEVRYRLTPRFSLVAGVFRLHDRSRVSFTYDQGSGPEPGFLEYEVEDWPVYAGVYREFPFTDRVDYRIGGMLVWFPASALRVSGRIGSGMPLDEQGTTDGLGALFSFGGDITLTPHLALTLASRLRLGRIGDPKDGDGFVIKNFFNQALAPMDWSGVDLVIGLTYHLF